MAAASSVAHSSSDSSTGWEKTVSDEGWDHEGKATTIDCIECGCSSGLYWQGWRAYRTDDPESVGELPALAFYCPTCAIREFGCHRS
jgi:hypothetical protein